MPKKTAQKRRPRTKKRTAAKRKNSKLFSKLKRGFQVLSVFAIAALFLAGYGLYNRLNMELASAFSSSSEALLEDDIYGMTFLVVDTFYSEPVIIKEAYFVLIDMSTLKLMVYTIPVDVEVDAPGKFGDEPIKNIMALGSLSESGDLSYSVDLVNKSITKLLGFPIDRYILVEPDSRDMMFNLITGDFSTLSALNEFEKLKDEVRTNYSISEMYKLSEYTSSLPKDRIIRKDITQSYIENSSLLDEEFMDITFDSVVSREKKSIALLNATKIGGIANYGARLVKNIGGRVVVVGNSKNAYDESLMIVDDIYSETTIILSRIFDIDNVILNSNARDFGESEIERSDITIIFGLDFGESL